MTVITDPAVVEALKELRHRLLNSKNRDEDYHFHDGRGYLRTEFVLAVISELSDSEVSS